MSNLKFFLLKVYLDFPRWIGVWFPYNHEKENVAATQEIYTKYFCIFFNILIHSII